jgi:chemotaxis protein MotA
MPVRIYTDKEDIDHGHTMNPSTLLGMLGGVLILGLAIFFSTDNVSVFINVPGIAIVVGGTFAATILSYPLGEVLRVFHVFLIVLRNEHLYTHDDIKEIEEIARLWFRGDLASVEREMDNIQNPFLRMGVQLVIDDTPQEEIMALLQWRIARLRAKEAAEAQVFRSMATYAPAFGMLGTLIGLINMLFSMEGSGFEQIGQNLSVALVTTFYGILLANLLFKPISTKLERRTEERVKLMHMVMEGITLLHKRRSPNYIRDTLHTFNANYRDEIHQRHRARKARKQDLNPARK